MGMQGKSKAAPAEEQKHKNIEIKDYLMTMSLNAKDGTGIHGWKSVTA